MSATVKPDLLISNISDPDVRKNFERLADYFKNQNQLLDFKFFEQVFTAAQNGLKLAHGLAYIPLDVIVTHLTGSGKVTFEYGEFDSTNIVLSASGPCRIRFFVGTCQKVQTNVQTGSSDAQTFGSAP